MGRPVVAKDVVRFVGEIVAVVVSDDRATGADAAELVMVDYDPLPVVVDPEEALKDETLLFPEAGTNVAARTQPPAANADDLFDGCDVTVSGTLVSQRMAPCPLEPRSTAAQFEDGRLTAWLCTQTPHQDRDAIAGMLGLEPTQVRVIAPDVGGGFGAKIVSLERPDGGDASSAGSRASSAGRCAGPRRAARACSRSRTGGRCGSSYTIGGTRDGKVLAYKLDILADCGAYPTLGAFLADLTALMSSGVYDIPRIEVEGTTVVTNTTQIAAFRGAGRPEAIQAIERAIDLFAAEIGMDPAEVRRMNYIGEFPHTDRLRRELRLGRLRRRARPRAALGRLRRAARRAEAAPRREGDEAARHRPLLVRRDHEPARRGRARRGRDHRRTARRSSAPARSPTARGTRRASR